MSDILPRIIGVMSGKGGVGKTTVVSNLSIVLAKYNKNVTVIDCNVTTSHLGMHFGIYSSPITTNKLLRGESSIEDIVIDVNTGVKILPASLNLSDLIGLDVAGLDKIKKMFHNEDFVILDIAPGFGKEAVSAMKAANEVLLVTTPELPAVADILKGINVLEELNVGILGIIINKVTGKDFELTRSEIRELTNLPVIAEIPFTFDLMRSVAIKTPLVAYDEKSLASQRFFSLGYILTGVDYKLPRTTIFDKIKKFIGK